MVSGQRREGKVINVVKDVDIFGFFELANVVNVVGYFFVGFNIQSCHARFSRARISLGLRTWHAMSLRGVSAVGFVSTDGWGRCSGFGGNIWVGFLRFLGRREMEHFLV